MTPPAGTFLATVRKGAVQLPPPLHRYCASKGWNLFRFVTVDADRMNLMPVLPGAEDESFDASLDPDGHLWIPAESRNAVHLGEQSVMMRVEGEGISVYLRKVFETLGFRPR